MNTAGVDYDKLDKDASHAFYNDLNRLGKTGDAEHDYYKELRNARWQIENEEMLPQRTPYGELQYGIQQGLRSAVLAHEEAFAARNLQLVILKRIDRNRNYMVAIIALLIYFAVKLN
jgi:hypothetical protein